MARNPFSSKSKHEEPAEKPAAKPVDPVEAAKVAAPPPPAPPKPAAPPPVIALPPEPLPLASPHKGHKAKVKVTKKVSLHGHMTTLPAGTIISEDSYGPGIFERLHSAKVELEPMD